MMSKTERLETIVEYEMGVMRLRNGDKKAFLPNYTLCSTMCYYCLEIGRSLLVERAVGELPPQN